MLHVKNVSVSVNDRFLIQNISFCIKQGEIYGLIGSNGAGKTTLIKTLVGLIRPTSGEILINNITFDSPGLLAGIGALIERAPLYNHLSAYNNLKVAAIQYGMNESRINEVLEIIGLLEESNKQVKNFSMGMKQRLGIGLAIMHNPNILILDEPTNGLDPEGVNQVREVLLSINRLSSTTILIASHVLSELEKVVTHIGVVQNGLMIFNGPFDSFKKADTLEMAYNKALL